MSISLLLLSEVLRQCGLAFIDPFLYVVCCFRCLLSPLGTLGTTFWDLGTLGTKCLKNGL